MKINKKIILIILTVILLCFACYFFLQSGDFADYLFSQLENVVLVTSEIFNRKAVEIPHDTKKIILTYTPMSLYKTPELIRLEITDEDEIENILNYFKNESYVNYELRNFVPFIDAPFRIDFGNGVGFLFTEVSDEYVTCYQDNEFFLTKIPFEAKEFIYERLKLETEI